MLNIQPWQPGWLRVDGPEGLRTLLASVFATWRAGFNFTITFTSENGEQAGEVVFVCPEDHRDYTAEVLEVHGRER